jgi:septal ring factor EnvC (AmiA/AmiB activator)
MAGTITEMKLDIKELTCDIKTVTRDMNVLSGEVTKVATRVSTREQVIDDIRSNQKRLQKKEWFK